MLPTTKASAAFGFEVPVQQQASQQSTPAGVGFEISTMSPSFLGFSRLPHQIAAVTVAGPTAPSTSTTMTTFEMPSQQSSPLPLQIQSQQLGSPHPSILMSGCDLPQQQPTPPQPPLQQTPPQQVATQQQQEVPAAPQSSATQNVSNPQSSDACMSIVQSLLCHSCAEAETFSKRAIESLVRKMKDKREELDALITAITTNGAIQTPCVTIQRTLDGRLQVAGRKGFPHVIYARIWRWPDLSRSELVPMKNCIHSFNHKSDLVCVNPYHYERVVASPTGLDFSTLSLSSPECDSELSSLGDKLSSPQKENMHAVYHAPNKLAQVPPMNSHSHPISNVLQDSTGPYYSTQHSITQRSDDQMHPPSGPIAIMDSSRQGVSGRLCTIRPHPPHWCSITYFELDQQVGDSFKVSSKYSTVTIDGYTNPAAADRFCLGYLSSVHRPPEVEKARLHIGRGVRLMTYNEGDVFLENLSDISIFLSSPFLDEQNNRTVGNAVHKIYPGAQLKVFDLNKTYEMMKKKAKQAREEAIDQARAVAGPGYVAGSNTQNAPNGAAVGVDELRRLCILSMSFVKGWGLDYPRNNMKDCPCWVEVHLYRALQVLDDVLQF